MEREKGLVVLVFDRIDGCCLFVRRGLRRRCERFICCYSAPSVVDSVDVQNYTSFLRTKSFSA